MSDLAEGRSRLCAPSRSEEDAAFSTCSIGCRTKATACCSTKERTCTQQRPTSGSRTDVCVMSTTGAHTATETVSWLTAAAVIEGLRAMRCSFAKEHTCAAAHCSVTGARISQCGAAASASTAQSWLDGKRVLLLHSVTNGSTCSATHLVPHLLQRLALLLRC